MYDLQELSDEPDPHATLPFISHHTLNISRDLVDKNAPTTTTTSTNTTDKSEFYRDDTDESNAQDGSFCGSRKVPNIMNNSELLEKRGLCFKMILTY